MQDVIYNIFGSSHPISYVNAVLLSLLFFFGKQRYQNIIEENKNQQSRINRLERSLLSAGIKLCDLEE